MYDGLPYRYSNPSYADTERCGATAVRRLQIQHVVALRRFVVEVRQISVRGYNSLYWYGGPSCADTERRRGTTARRRGTASRNGGIQTAVALRQPVVCGYNTLYRYSQWQCAYGEPSYSYDAPSYLYDESCRDAGKSFCFRELPRPYSSRNAVATGRRAARIAGSSPPSRPIARAIDVPRIISAGVTRKAKATWLKLCQLIVAARKPLKAQ
jgi:hypothetical protein